jgi:ribosomal protein L12E/L44/L45/RPP1/RPP2
MAPVVPAVLAVQPAAPVAPVPPTPPLPPGVSMQINDDSVTINGQTKRWKELSPAEKQHIRGEIAKAKAELARTHIDRAGIEREVREALRDAQVSRRDAARDIAQARVEMDLALRQIDTNAAVLRKHGVDPEAIKAQIRASLKAVEAIDVEAITRQAMASVNPEAIAASAAAAESSVAKAQAEIDRIEAQLERADEQSEDQDD